MKFFPPPQKTVKTVHIKEWTQGKGLRAIRKSFGRSGGSDRHQTRQHGPHKFGLVDIQQSYAYYSFSSPPPPNLLTIEGPP